MKILLTGAAGLIGSALRPALERDGHEVIPLRRGLPEGGERAGRAWDPGRGWFSPGALEDLDAVVHLAGETIAALRWTAAKKQRIRDSRVAGTRLLCETLARLARPPRALIAASAIGYYGDRGGEILTEDSGPGRGFFPELCRDWEAATRPAAGAGLRVANLRFGVVLSRAGGALPRLLPPFQFGLGGPLGRGDQYMSWVALEDAVNIVRRALRDETLRGPVNAASSQPVTNREFTRALGTILGRPTFFRVPAFVLQLVLGEMAGPLLLASARVEPAKLTACGYGFRMPSIEEALANELARR
ncbi:MAG TPA: TIGR01777 family oxidoreductase [Kiritimatiellia bacterium]|nr:TIGR01777 family oxidoreductase [Kiritimatiellia bacterium]HRZ12237.1 TIGR01777 family oxidoreductase [Kiritimatiellia bacterium]HSA18005.1 TIGR01777 family oxidoreductase [Kiritimatiellia bacterium]